MGALAWIRIHIMPRLLENVQELARLDILVNRDTELIQRDRDVSLQAFTWYFEALTILLSGQALLEVTVSGEAFKCKQYR